MHSKRGRGILVDVERIRYGFSGIGYYCHCLERGLREKAPSAELDFYRPVDDRESGGVQAYRGWHRLYNPSCRGYALLHVTNQLDHYFLRHAHVGKKVITLHDLNFLRESFSAKKQARLLGTVRKNLEGADGIVCISEFVRRDLEANLSLFNLKEGVQIRVIHNGLIFEDLPPEGGVRNELEGHSFLLGIGVLQEKKQQHRLVEMQAYLPESLHLVLVYSAKHQDYYERIQDTIRRLKLEDRVYLLGRVAADEKAWLLNHASGLLHPSIAEGFGIPPIEAMHAGKPVFLSQYTSLPEIGGKEAFYWEASCSPEEMAHTVVEGLKAYQEDTGKSARLRAWAEQYDYRRMAQAYYEFYQSLQQQ